MINYDTILLDLPYDINIFDSYSKYLTRILKKSVSENDNLITNIYNFQDIDMKLLLNPNNSIIQIIFKNHLFGKPDLTFKIKIPDEILNDKQNDVKNLSDVIFDVEHRNQVNNRFNLYILMILHYFVSLYFLDAFVNLLIKNEIIIFDILNINDISFIEDLKDMLYNRNNKIKDYNHIVESKIDIFIKENFQLLLAFYYTGFTFSNLNVIVDYYINDYITIILDMKILTLLDMYIILKLFEEAYKHNNINFFEKILKSKIKLSKLDESIIMILPDESNFLFNYHKIKIEKNEITSVFIINNHESKKSTVKIKNFLQDLKLNINISKLNTLKIDPLFSTYNVVKNKSIYTILDKIDIELDILDFAKFLYKITKYKSSEITVIKT